MGISEAKRKKQNKKNENETKNIFGYVLDGIKDCNGQDSFHYFGFEVDNTNIKFMGVYDGHGTKGKEASQYINKELKKLITDNKNKLKKWSMQANSREVITKMFVNGYKKIQQQMKKDSTFDLSGSCAISALLIDKVCYVINLGDSRAVIGGKLIDNIFAIQMSIDHKPSLPEEMERIKKSGGEVKSNDSGGPMRVYKLNDTNPGLAVARSLGDCYGHECGVGDEPQVSYRILEETDEFTKTDVIEDEEELEESEDSDDEESEDKEESEEDEKEKKEKDIEDTVDTNSKMFSTDEFKTDEFDDFADLKTKGNIIVKILIFIIIVTILLGVLYFLNNYFNWGLIK